MVTFHRDLNNAPKVLTSMLIAHMGPQEQECKQHVIPDVKSLL